jgi:hypothetical protein
MASIRLRPDHQNVFQVVVIFAGGFFHAVGHLKGVIMALKHTSAVCHSSGEPKAYSKFSNCTWLKLCVDEKTIASAPYLFLDLEHVVGDQVQRFFPRRFAEFAFAAFAHPDEGRQHTVGVVGVHQTRLPART